MTQPSSPTTTGKVERFHQTLRRELLTDHPPFADLAAVQAALDEWVQEYNTERPHQSLDMAVPASRFLPAQDRATAAEELVPLRLPATLTMTTSAGPADPVGGEARDGQPPRESWRGGPVEIDRVVPASGNMFLAGRQFWLGPARAGMTVTFWADLDVIHLLIGGARLKSVRSHLSVTDRPSSPRAGAGPPVRLRSRRPALPERSRSTGP